MLSRIILALGLSPAVKRIGTDLRFRVQLARSRINHSLYSDAYPQKILFIAGLPKSGTTWLKRMLCSYQGYVDILIPEVSKYEIKTGGSHDFDLPSDLFNRFNRSLILTKMHVHGSSHNVNLLRESKLNYVVLYRDLRDVAVSYCYYVRRHVWHPQYPIYSRLTVEEGLMHFGETLLEKYRDWVLTWEENHDHQRGMIVRYEDLTANPIQVMTEIVNHFSLDSSLELLSGIVERNSFSKLSQGRDHGDSDPNSFYRKGTVGDWKNHFSTEVRTLYKKKIGQFLIDYGYETDRDW